MRPKILSNWLGDFQKILVTCTPYFQEIWQLLCCWSEYAWLYLAKFWWRSELQISQLSVLKHLCGVAFLSASLCGEPFVTLLHPFVEASVWMVIWSSCSWNFVFGELYIFYPPKELLSCQIPKNYEILSIASALHLLLWEKTKFHFCCQYSLKCWWKKANYYVKFHNKAFCWE